MYINEINNPTQLQTQWPILVNENRCFHLPLRDSSVALFGVELMI